MTNRLQPLLDQLRSVGRPWENETAALCDEAAEVIERLARQNEIAQYERKRANARVDNAVEIFTKIHSLLYPPRITDGNGVTYEFKYPGDPHELLQALSDRIRAIPDEVAELKQGVDNVR